MIDVLVAATYAEAKDALPLLPADVDREALRLVSTHASEATVDGMRIRRIFLAPGAIRGPRYFEVLAVLKRCAAKAKGDDSPVTL